MHAQPSRNDGTAPPDAADTLAPDSARAPNTEHGLPTPQRYWAMLVIALALPSGALAEKMASYGGHAAHTEEKKA